MVWENKGNKERDKINEDEARTDCSSFIHYIRVSRTYGILHDVIVD